MSLLRVLFPSILSLCLPFPSAATPTLGAPGAPSRAPPPLSSGRRRRPHPTDLLAARARPLSASAAAAADGDSDGLEGLDSIDTLFSARPLATQLLAPPPPPPPPPAPLLATAPAVSKGKGLGIGRRQAGLFGLTYVAYVALYFARKPVSVVKSTLEGELGLSVAGLGIIDTAMLAAYAAGQFLTGAYVSIVGRTAALVLAFGLCGILTFAFGLANSVPVMALCWGGCGLFAASVNPLLVLLVADLVPPTARASAVGLWQTSQQLGGVAANAVASAVLAKAGWRSVFFRSGIIVFAFAPLLLFALSAAKSSPTPTPTPPPTPTRTLASTPTPAQSPARASASAVLRKRTPLSLPGVGSVGAAYTLVKMSRYCLMFWLPYFFTRHARMGPATAALVATVFDMAGVAGSVCAGLFVDGVYGGRMIGITLPISAAAAAAFFAWSLLCIVERGRAPLWGGMLHVLAMAVVGLLIATPDSVLGGAASRNLVDYAAADAAADAADAAADGAVAGADADAGAGADAALAAAVSGLVNGCGSLGAIAQGVLTAKLVELVGWAGLFGTLGVAMAATAVVVRPAVAIEKRALASRG